MFLLVLKLYQMDVAHAILLSGKIDFSRLTTDYLSAKFELIVLNCHTKKCFLIRVTSSCYCKAYFSCR